MQRRTFIKHGATVVALSGALPALGQHPTNKEKAFKMCLNAGAIGVDANLQELMALAVKYGFQAIVPSTSEFMQLTKEERSKAIDQMKKQNIHLGSAGLPLEFRKSEAIFQKDLEDLPNHAAVLQEVGGTRMNTWIMPTHKTLPYRKNFEQHSNRLKAVANILGHYGIRLGLEYVGPKTLMARDKFAFIRTMAEGKELIEAIDESNVGFVLDSFHWFCAGENPSDILTLDPSDIVTVDLNDARSGFTADEQIDGKRELPAATGVIDVKGFLSALIQVGYDGPIRAEPFNQPLRDMNNEDATKTTFEAMQKAFDMV